MSTVAAIRSRLPADGSLSGSADDERGQGLCVIATTDTGTRLALTTARDLSQGLNLRVVLLVPHIVPHALPLEHPADPVTFTEARFRRLAEDTGTDILVRVCICRPETASLEAMLPRQATVLIGGTYRRWWRSQEQRLARRLTTLGHRVLFIDAALTR